MKRTLVIILSIVGIILLIGIGILIYFNVTYLSKSEAREIFLDDVIKYKDNIHISKVELDIEENLYEIEFYYLNQDTEYECKMDAKTGKIIYNNFRLNNQPVTNNQNNTNQSSEITLAEAKMIAVKDINTTENSVNFIETKTDYDDGRKNYEIEFIYNNNKYSYEIDASTGEILSFDKDIRR